MSFYLLAAHCRLAQHAVLVPAQQGPVCPETTPHLHCVMIYLGNKTVLEDAFQAGVFASIIWRDWLYKIYSAKPFISISLPLALHVDCDEGILA